MARFDNKVGARERRARGQGAAEARLLVAQGAKVVFGDVRQSWAVVGCRAWAGCVLRPARCDSEADWARRRRSAPRSSAACTAWSTMPESTSRPR